MSGKILEDWQTFRSWETSGKNFEITKISRTKSKLLIQKQLIMDRLEVYKRITSRITKNHCYIKIRTCNLTYLTELLLELFWRKNLIFVKLGTVWWHKVSLKQSTSAVILRTWSGFPDGCVKIWPAKSIGQTVNKMNKVAMSNQFWPNHKQAATILYGLKRSSVSGKD